jgi:endonuclease/exonuclease/phosphatase family metal-dependent hydrolase
MLVRALTWNLFHGRDFPPNQALRTQRSRVLRVTERDDTYAQVNRDLRDEFVDLIAAAEWDVALLQECPPRWCETLAAACGADSHRVLTSRNSWAPLRRAGAWLNPDLIGSNEGGSNVTLVRPALGMITERRELAVSPGPVPERRVMAFTRTQSGICISNLHASAGLPLKVRAEDEIRLAAERSLEWAGEVPVLLGGDLNVRPAQSQVYDELRERFGLAAPTAPDSLDHLLVRGLETVDPPAAWASELRDRPYRDRLIRLSDHAPVAATFSFTTPG